jgi:hypothetical protein
MSAVENAGVSARHPISRREHPVRSPGMELIVIMVVAVLLLASPALGTDSRTGEPGSGWWPGRRRADYPQRLDTHST